MDVPYIGKAGRVESRPIRLYIPQNAGQPMPLVYVPHYEMAADSLELRRYLEKGWAVASPARVKSAYNGLLTDDDLVFNCAALYTLRHMGMFDTQRVALVGGSGRIHHAHAQCAANGTLCVCRQIADCQRVFQLLSVF